jgi:hypothetical protein
LSGHVVWHALSCWVEQNWRPQAMPNRLQCGIWKLLMLWLVL